MSEILKAVSAALVETVAPVEGSVGRDLPEMEATRRGRAREWLMAGLVLRPGNSGGPLVDVRGRLLGVNTIMTGPEVGGAVPVRVVQAFLTEALLN